MLPVRRHRRDSSLVLPPITAKSASFRKLRRFSQRDAFHTGTTAPPGPITPLRNHPSTGKTFPVSASVLLRRRRGGARDDRTGSRPRRRANNPISAAARNATRWFANRSRSVPAFIVPGRPRGSKTAEVVTRSTDKMEAACSARPVLSNLGQKYQLPQISVKLLCVRKVAGHQSMK